jgi:outer membrane receptor for ferrienterochelin and colicins
MIKVIAACLLSVAGGIGSLHAQKLMGIVVELDATGQDQPLPGATVHWLGTTSGTTTRDNGVFMIDRMAGNDQLVVSFVGFRADTMQIKDESNIKVVLASNEVLDEVTVQGWRPTTRFDQTNPINVAIMDEKELFKAACCNLSESFETNPSVDVAYTDAVTGTRQIQMLGLSGPNTMISLENMPGVRGLASSQGIQFIPGSWISSIQVTKGIGSVVNGYESIAGQINVEMKKPQESDKLFLNGYLSNSQRSELNLVVTTQAGKKWATTFLLHGSVRPVEMDQNEDSFLDFPTGSQVNLVNRWVYNSGTGWLGQFSLKYLNDQKQGGQTGFNPETDKFTTNRYGLEINTERAELVGKLGYQVPGKPWKSVGFQVSGIYHTHDSYYGFNVHDAVERSVYSNLIFQSIIGSTDHKYKVGTSFLYDDFDETLDQTAFAGSYDFGRTEIVPGVFAEYTYTYLDKFNLIAGVRADYHNLFGLLFVPRVHMSYSATPTTSFRLSGGRGVRVANVISENTGFLASARQLNLTGQQSEHAYGFNPDKAWNGGVNFTQDFTLDYRGGSFVVDYFYTTFENQAVMDFDSNVREMNIFGLEGKSFSHSFQAQLDYQLARRFDVRLAYRFVDVQTDYLSGRMQRPLIPRERAFMNLAYRTKSGWTFDYTIQRVGTQRIPTTAENPADHRLPSFSDPYWLMNAQVTRDFGQHWSVYLGVENITNFRLDDPIISAHDPFGPYFDSSMVWGPVFGRMFYGGFRYRIK